MTVSVQTVLRLSPKIFCESGRWCATLLSQWASRLMTADVVQSFTAITTNG